MLFDTDKWQIEVARSAMPGHLSGWLTNKGTGQRYVFSIVGERVRYMREYKPPTTIPKYMDQYLLDLRQVILKDGIKPNAFSWYRPRDNRALGN